VLVKVLKDINIGYAHGTGARTADKGASPLPAVAPRLPPRLTQLRQV
jgi:hypothetical protein